MMMMRHTAAELAYLGRHIRWCESQDEFKTIAFTDIVQVDAEPPAWLSGDSCSCRHYVVYTGCRDAAIPARRTCGCIGSADKA
jgi:hypothetical protein